MLNDETEKTWASKQEEKKPNLSESLKKKKIATSC